MKKALLSLAVAAMSMYAVASDADLLIWEIDLYGNKHLEGTGFDAISQFYLRSISDPSKTISLSPYTYFDIPFSQTTADPTFASGIAGGSDGWTVQNGQTVNYYAFNMASLIADNGITDYSGYEFIMQLTNNGNLVGWSEHLWDASKNPLLLSAVKSNLLNSEDVGNMMNPEFDIRTYAFNFGSHLVPEPTSGLLMMLGAGLLALRRRRRS